MYSITKLRGAFLKCGSAFFVKFSGYLAATNPRKPLTKQQATLLRSLVVGVLSTIGLVSALTAEDVWNNGMEEGTWVNSSISTLEWSGVAMMSPTLAVTQKLLFAVYPVNGDNELVEDFEIPIIIRAEAKSAPGTWRVDKAYDYARAQDFASYTEPKIGKPGDTHIELTEMPFQLGIDWLTLQPNLWMPGRANLHRFWSEPTAPGGINFAAKAYIDYETPFPILLPFLMAQYPLATEYRLVLRGQESNTPGPIIEFGTCPVALESFGINFIAFDWKLTDGDSFIMWIQLEMKKPGDPLFSTLSMSPQFHVNLDD